MNILEKNPSGATIDKDTGAFSWTPTSAQFSRYDVDIVVKAASCRREKVWNLRF